MLGILTLLLAIYKKSLLDWSLAKILALLGHIHKYVTKPILCYGKIGLSHCELKRHSLNLKNATAFLLQNHNFNQKC